MRRSLVRALLVVFGLGLQSCDDAPQRQHDTGTADGSGSDTDGAVPHPADGAPAADADGAPLPGAAFVVGYNLGSASAASVTVDGHTLSPAGPGGNASLRLSPVGGGPVAAWHTEIPASQLVPQADEMLVRLLNEHVSVPGGGLLIEQGLSDGTYQVFTYHMENNAEPARAFHVAVQGTTVTTAPVALAQHHWVRLGPFAVQVQGGVLRVELQRVTGDASIMGLELYSTTGGKVQDLPASPGPAGWKLVWSEEFDTPGLPNPATWGYEEGYVRNGELQYYTRARSENARVENGTLVLEARQDNHDGHEITAASVITKGKHEFRYGRVEVRAQLPAGLGVWPAIWTLGADIDTVSWPRCGEIDIMEYVGFDPDTIYGTAHMTDSGGAHTARGGKTTASAPYSGFHVYAIEWRADRIDFFFDDTKYFTFDKSEPNTVWAFDKPHYLLLNLAFGGSWGGQQGVDKSILPVRFTVDYVRIYEPSN